MKKLLLIMIILSGCMSGYQPELSRQPSDSVKYENDRQACLKDLDRRSKAALDYYYDSGRWAFGALGAVGGTTEMATSDSSKDYSKSGRTMMDECMTARGYAVIKQTHCC